MLKSIKISGFKSLENVSVDLPRLAVLFGPNATGKSNFIDALQLLSRLSSARTVADALSGPIRGYPMEQFTFPDGGLPELLQKSESYLSLEGDLVPQKGDPIRYRIGLRLEPEQGIVTVDEEFLVRLKTRTFEPKGKARIEKEGNHLSIRRLGEAGQPRQEQLPLSHTTLSDTRNSGNFYPDFDRARNELNSWHIYYLDPRVAMRQPTPPQEVYDIGPLGQNLAQFLYRLKWKKELFKSVVRTLRMAIPSIDDVLVELDEKRGELDLQIVQEGTPFSSRVVSEGTLRVLALCAIALNPWPGSLIAFEEPENGVHPKRLEVIVNLLSSIALDEAKNRQVIVTTHSPLFVSKIFRLQEEKRKENKQNEIGLFICRGEDRKSIIESFTPTGALFVEDEIRKALESPSEDILFREMITRGWLGG